MFDVFLSMSLEHKAISLVILGVVGVAIYYILRTLKKAKKKVKPITGYDDNSNLDTWYTRSDDPRYVKKVAEENLVEEKGRNVLRPFQREGITGYTREPRKGLEQEKYTKRKASELTKEEAWSELSKSFWEIRMDGLKQLHPEAYVEIMYWETHLDEYNTRIGMKWVLGIPLEEYETWVRRRKQ